jgi:hypothetical protein
VGKYLPSRTEVITFDGDNVTVILDPVTFADASAMRDAKGEDSVQIAKKYVRSMTGLRDANGDQIPMDKVFTEFYFAELAIEITKRVLSTGSVTKEEERPFDKR